MKVFTGMNKFYRGWWVLLGLSLMYIGSNGFGIYTIPLFYPSISEELALTKGVITQAPSNMYLILVLCSPFCGWLLDRFAPRVILGIAAFIMSVLFLSLSMISTFEQFKWYYLFFGVALSLGGVIPSVYLISRWFDKHRGIALGLFLNASSLGATILSKPSGHFLETGGWRTAATYVGIPVVGIILLAQFLLKNRPTEEEFQYEWTSKNHHQQDLSLSEALRQPTFFTLLIATAALWFCINGILFNKDLFLTDLHLIPSQTANFASLFFFFSIIGKIVFGYISDKIRKKDAMLASIVVLGIGVLLLKTCLINTDLLAISAIVLGMGYSGAFTMIQLLIAEHYAGKSYGLILGVFTMIDTLAGSIGIRTIGQLRASTGSYKTSFEVMLTLCIIATVLVFFSRKKKV
ncbi:MFS transporter [Flectobacillus sp. DC10W]|uniref:MFS transporter n=1 Tax=Flectobacillus longus TaxID=2984207 RepID=A0ABT6YI50_9BACT|nr:MFS transporter [Flectobacillus longus]MDI9863268.1 MFS transporter [Flectobacillus longus]